MLLRLHLSRLGDLHLYENTLWVKNIGTIYQCLVDMIFKDQIGKNAKAYINKIIVKILFQTNYGRDRREVL